MIILDSTLREGEQTKGVSFSIEQKIAFAKLIDDFGVEMLEVGHPNVSPQIHEAVKAIAKEDLNAEVVAHVRAVKSDIDNALACDVDRIVIFLPTSDVHLEKKLGKNRQQVLDMITQAVEYTRDHGVNVRYTPEDATRTDIGFLVEVARQATECGADRVSIADTVGIATPALMENIVRTVSDSVNVELDVHCHNDLGLALANALAGINAGATCVHTTVNGLGERCGIVDLAPLVMSTKVHGYSTSGYKLDMLPEIYEFIESATNIPIGYNSPVIGRNAFAHKSGVHTDGVLKSPDTYEPYNPKIIGREREIVIDRYTGRLAVKKRLESLGYSISNETLMSIVNEVKIFSDANGGVSDDSLVQITGQILTQERS